ncbi:glycosyl hydrolase [Bradyrhizobium elkanii]|uniref:glycosyl hydrolase n=1 Tax=Bradyrhizobium elkanii TaxID=29448 RepID=UPI002012A33C|nr:glycosyl hydrolase [Bradyrhizobium elkanii]
MAGRVRDWGQRALIALVLSALLPLAYKWPLQWAGLTAYDALNASRVNAVIPPTLFGMTINAIGQSQPKSQPWPELKFDGVRLWGAIYWAQINPAPGIYNWARFDAILAAAEREHVEIVLNLAYTPRWAASVKDAPPAFTPGASSPPADLASWDDWVRAAVTRAAGRIKYWEIWNEPEDPKYYLGDIATMVQLQKRAYEIIKASDPTLTVLTPPSNGTPDGYRWQEAFMAQGGGQYADVFAFHGYTSEPEAVLGIIARFKKILAAHDLSARPIWDTEAGWSSYEDNPDGCLARAYILKWISGVDRFYWYEFAGGGSDFGKLWDPARGLLPSGIAYRTIQSWLVGASVVAAGRTSLSSWRVELRMPDGRNGLILWTTKGRSVDRVDPHFSLYQGLDGGEGPVANGEVEISPKPVLLLE